MKGAVAVALKEMILKEFNEEMWVKIAKRAGISPDQVLLPISNVDENLFQKVREATLAETGLSDKEIGLKFGEVWVNSFTPRVYGAYYSGHNSAKELLLDLDRIHVSVTKNVPGATPPRLDYEWQDDQTLILRYKSHRHMIDYLIGGIYALGRKYNEQIEAEKLDESTVKVKFQETSTTNTNQKPLAATR